MKTGEESFKLDLTAGELLWLSRALGKIRLILPGDPFHRLLQTEIEQNIQAGQASLAQRGLIRLGDNRAWEIDRFAAILLTWLAEPDELILVEVIRRESPTTQAGVYIWQKKGLLLLVEADNYQVNVFPDEEQLQKAWLKTLGMGFQPSLEPRDVLDIPQPKKFLQLAWNNREEALHLLVENGIATDEAERILDQLHAWETLATMITYKSKDGSLQPLNSQFMAKDGSHLWGSEVESGKDERVRFVVHANMKVLSW